MKQRPRRRKPTAAARFRPFWLALVFIVALVAAGAYALSQWPAMWPHTIVVEGNHRVAADAITSVADIRMQETIWLQNTRAMDRRIEAIPYIATAAVHRRPPGTFIIDVTEREPFAIVRSREGTVLVDHDLRVLQPVPKPAPELPVLVVPAIADRKAGAFLTAPTLLALRGDVDALLVAHIAVASVAHDRFGDLEATLRDGIRVLFGDESQLAKAIPYVEPILTQVARGSRPVAAIDLRSTAAPVVVYKK